jgi:hypothetical protein
VAAVVEEEQVPGPRVPDEPRELPPDVGPRGHRQRRGAVGVEQDADVRLVEAEAVDEAAAHAGDVVVAALELRLGARVVDAHQHRALRPHRRPLRTRVDQWPPEVRQRGGAIWSGAFKNGGGAEALDFFERGVEQSFGVSDLAGRGVPPGEVVPAVSNRWAGDFGLSACVPALLLVWRARRYIGLG